MNAIDRWAERIYAETDFAKSIATSFAAAIGLLVYLLASDWVIAAFALAIVFPIARLLSASIQHRIDKTTQRNESTRRATQMFDSLCEDEKDVIAAFVRAGGSVLTWRQTNNSNISSTAIESLIQRDVLSTSVTADGMRETFVLDMALFDLGCKKFQRNRAPSAAESL